MSTPSPTRDAHSRRPTPVPKPQPVSVPVRSELEAAPTGALDAPAQGTGTPLRPTYIPLGSATLAYVCGAGVLVRDPGQGLHFVPHGWWGGPR